MRVIQMGLSRVRTGDRHIGLVLAVCVGLALPVTGCQVPAAGDGAQPTGGTTAGSAMPVRAVATEAAEAPGAAGDFAAEVTQTLTALAAQSPRPSREEMRAAFAAAGAQEASVSVSIDITPTGLEVDAMSGAVVVEGVCVFGYVRDGAVTVTQLPVLSGGACFVGDQR